MPILDPQALIWKWVEIFNPSGLCVCKSSYHSLTGLALCTGKSCARTKKRAFSQTVSTKSESWNCAKYPKGLRNPFQPQKHNPILLLSALKMICNPILLSVLCISVFSKMLCIGPQGHFKGRTDEIITISSNNRKTSEILKRGRKHMRSSSLFDIHLISVLKSQIRRSCPSSTHYF